MAASAHFCCLCHCRAAAYRPSPEWDEWVRRSWSVFVQSSDPWLKLAERNEQLPISSPSDITLLGLCASHGNGYVREAAVARLAQVQNGLEVGFLILRANDWVPSVQIRAQTALMSRLNLIRQDLQGDFAVQSGVLRQIHLSHAPAPSCERIS
jgi:hypothetical protein